MCEKSDVKSNFPPILERKEGKYSSFLMVFMVWEIYLFFNGIYGVGRVLRFVEKDGYL